jgi:hypothetical protein
MLSIGSPLDEPTFTPPKWTRVWDNNVMGR